MSDQREPDDFLPTASWANLRRRAELMASLRQFFVAHGFLEVETPLLSADVVIDRHIEPFRTVLAADVRQPDRGQTLWLQTSPEAAMKRLMAAGGEAIFQVTRSFRNGERGRWHNPEFTIVEWYRRGDSMASGIDLLDALCQTLLQTPSAIRTSYAAAFERSVGVNPHRATAVELAALCRGLDITIPEGFESSPRDAWLDLLLVERVEPQLGQAAPEVIYDYPASQAALAQIRDEDPPVAERFELYYRGIELANGYHELSDADVLRDRTIELNAERTAAGLPSLPGAPRLVAAMQHGLPECTGVALGFDRLVMLALGANSIDEVLPFPIERA